MSKVTYPAYGTSGATKNNGISGTTKEGKNGLDVFVVGNGRSDFTDYEAKTFTITGAQSDYNVKTSESLFGTVESSRKTTIYADIACTIKLNSASADGIGLLAGEEITIEGLAVTNIFATTTADTDLRVILLG